MMVMMFYINLLYAQLFYNCLIETRTFII